MQHTFKIFAFFLFQLISIATFAQNKIEEALFAGSFHIVLEQPRLNSRMFQYENEYFQNKIEEFLNTNRRCLRWAF